MSYEERTHIEHIHENEISRTRMEVKNRRRHRRVIRDRLASTIGASRKGCSTRRIGHTQCNLTSCKKVPAYFFPQKTFPRPVLEVIDGGVAPTSPCRFLLLRCNHARRLRVSKGALYVHVRAHAFRDWKEIAEISFIHTRTRIVSVYTSHCLNLIIEIEWSVTRERPKPD